MEEISVLKGEVLSRPNTFSHKVFFVKQGLLRSYHLDEKGKEHTFLFAPEDWVISDLTTLDQPTELFIEALEDSTVLVSKKQLDLPLSDPKKIIKRLHVMQQRIILLMSSSAIQRFEYFQSTYPNLITRVPQKMIASFLGITPEALSKVKNEALKRS